MTDTYKKLAQKHGLPGFKELDNEFEIGSLEESNFPLRDVRKKMAEKLDLLGEILGQILQPNPDSIVDMYECKYFEDNEKDKVFALYKDIQILLRENLLCAIRADQKKDAEWIKAVHDSWKDLKQKSLPFIEMLKSTWKEKGDSETQLRYLG